MVIYNKIISIDNTNHIQSLDSLWESYQSLPENLKIQFLYQHHSGFIFTRGLMEEKISLKEFALYIESYRDSFHEYELNILKFMFHMLEKKAEPSLLAAINTIFLNNNINRDQKYHHVAAIGYETEQSRFHFKEIAIDCLSELTSPEARMRLLFNAPTKLLKQLLQIIIKQEPVLWREMLNELYILSQTNETYYHKIYKKLTKMEIKELLDLPILSDDCPEEQLWKVTVNTGEKFLARLDIFTPKEGKYKGLLRLENKQTIMTLKPLGLIGKKDSVTIFLCEDLITKKLYSVKPLHTEADELHNLIGQSYWNLFNNLDGFYHPEEMTSVKGEGTQWSGLEDAIAILYPFEQGISLHSYIEKKSELYPFPIFSKGFMDRIIDIVSSLSAMQKKGLPGVWDVNSDNCLVRENRETHLIDYTIMKTSVFTTALYLIIGSIELLHKKNPTISKNDISNMLDQTEFTTNINLNKKIISLLKTLIDKVYKGIYKDNDSLDNLLLDILPIRDLLGYQEYTSMEYYPK